MSFSFEDKEIEIFIRVDSAETNKFVHMVE